MMFRILFLLILLMPLRVVAQDSPFLVTEPTQARALGEVLSQAQCFQLMNQAPYMVAGRINTNYFIRPDGIKTRHSSNFRLKSNESREFCTSGPFYEGQKVELVLRTLIPIFNCKTAITGDVVIYGRHKTEGGTETWASCL